MRFIVQNDTGRVAEYDSETGLVEAYHNGISGALYSYKLRDVVIQQIVGVWRIGILRIPRDVPHVANIKTLPKEAIIDLVKILKKVYDISIPYLADRYVIIYIDKMKSEDVTKLKMLIQFY
jgi:hypothetical protein